MVFFSHKTQDREQFLRDVIRLYSKGLSLYARYYLKDEDEAQDVVQEVFIRLWEKPDIKHTSPGLFKRYLYLSVRNACLDKIGKKNVMQRHLERLTLETVPAEEFLVDERVIREIREEIDRMPPQTRNIVNLVFVRGMKYREVADELNISVNTVKSLLKTGLKRLREKTDLSANYGTE